jgi:hypothetical protein
VASSCNKKFVPKYTFQDFIPGPDLPQKMVRYFSGINSRILFPGPTYLKKRFVPKYTFQDLIPGPDLPQKMVLPRITFQELIPGFNFRARPTSKKRFVPKYTFQDLILGHNLH